MEQELSHATNTIEEVPFAVKGGRDQLQPRV